MKMSAIGAFADPTFPAPTIAVWDDDRGVGGVSPPMGDPAARHAAQARDEAGVMTFPRLAAQSTRVRIVQLLEARGDLTSRRARTASMLC